MRDYEIMLAVKGSLQEKEANTAVKELEDYISGFGSISERDDWSRIKMAYKIKHEEYAYYFVLRIKIENKDVAKLENHLNLHTEVIRFLLSIPENDTIINTYKSYKEGMEQYYSDKTERRHKSMPKTRASTSRQLEDDIKKLKNKKEDNARKEIEKDLKV